MEEQEDKDKEAVLDSGSEQQPLEAQEGGTSTDQDTIERPKRDAFYAYAREYMGDEYQDEDEEGNYERLTGRMKRDSDNAKALAEMLSGDPRLAQVMSDMYQKKRGAASAFVRYFGKDLMNAEEGSPEYEEIEAAEAERMEEANEMTRQKEEYEQNVRSTMPEVEAYCEENGKDLDSFLRDFWEKLIFPILNGQYSKELCRMMDKALSYDQDVEDALHAGEVKGRNTKIDRMRSEKGDGLPKGMASPGDGGEEQKPSRKGNRLIDLALQA